MVYFRHAWALLFAVSLLLIFGTIPIIILGQFGPADELEEISRFSAPLGSFARNLFRVLLLFVLGFGVLAAAVSATAYRRGEMWAWYASWIWPVIFVGVIIIFPTAPFPPSSW